VNGPRVAPIAAALAALTASMCGGGSTTAPSGPGGTTTPTTISTGPLVFRASPIDQSAIRWITPLGNLNPPDHALPTDHIYFYFADPNAGESPVARRTSFFAPADGTVEDVFGGATSSEQKVSIRATTTVRYYVDHLIPEIPIARGTKITAGQRLGTTGSVFAIDLGVVNDALTLSFVNPSRYADSESLHADAPLKYYEEPLRGQLYARVQCIGADRDGTIDFDLAGRLSGNWFVQGGTAPLAFVYDTYDPTQVRISAANGLSQVGVFAIAPGDPMPRDVSVASGKVRYTITRSQTGPPFIGAPAGRLLVQMLDDQRIQAEMFPVGAGADDFTGASRLFVR
jgi:hypothetical protein